MCTAKALMVAEFPVKQVCLAGRVRSRLKHSSKEITEVSRQNGLPSRQGQVGSLAQADGEVAGTGGA